MLVLSRKEDQKILFPNLGITVEVLRVKGNNVRIGVEAPRSVRVLRAELKSASDEGFDEPTAQENEKSEAAQERHEFRNRLNAATLSLHILQKQLDAGRFSDAEQSLGKALEMLGELEGIASGQELPSKNESLKIGTPLKSNSRRALVVEDNANERELLAGYLELCGYEVESVEDGLAAIDFLQSNQHPDVILVDMHMPRMNGKDTVAEIRCNPDYRDIKLFAVTGSDRKEMGLELGDRGVDGWFSKPLKPAEFVNRLHSEIATMN
jgi:carbon storage regulator CsrA